LRKLLKSRLHLSQETLVSDYKTFGAQKLQTLSTQSAHSHHTSCCYGSPLKTPSTSCTTSTLISKSWAHNLLKLQGRHGSKEGWLYYANAYAINNGRERQQLSLSLYILDYPLCSFTNPYGTLAMSNYLATPSRLVLSSTMIN
jgi:hypothetical protein